MPARGIELSPFRTSKVLWLLLALVLLTRLAFVLGVGAMHGQKEWIAPDSLVYIELAESMASGKFVREGSAEIIRTPGYPLMLVPGVTLGNIALFGVLLNALLAVLAAWLCWAIAVECTGSTRVGGLAAGLYLLEPVGFLLTTRVVTETPFSVLLLLSVLFIVKLLKSGGVRYAALGAAALACSAYIRPVSIYLSFALIPLLLLFPSGQPLLARIGRTVLFQAVFLAAVLPWVERNRRAAEYPGFAAIAEQSLYFYSAASVKARLEKRPFEQVQSEMGWQNPENYFKAHPEQRGWNSGKVALYRRAEAKKLLGENLIAYFKIHLRGCVIVMLDPGGTELLKLLRLYPTSGGLLGRTADQGIAKSLLWLFKEYPASVVSLAATGVFLVALYFFGLVGLRSLPISISLLFLGMFAYFIATSGGPVGVGRYRHPVMPVLCIAAAAGLTRLLDWRNNRRNKPPTEQLQA